MNNDYKRENKIVKAFETDRFEVALVEMPSGMYKVLSIKNGQQEPDVSESIQDYITASMLFDMRIRDLEGH
jgi:hypothetical protein